jgi:hypothetical protein
MKFSSVLYVCVTLCVLETCVTLYGIVDEMECFMLYNGFIYICDVVCDVIY